MTEDLQAMVDELDTLLAESLIKLLKEGKTVKGSSLAVVVNYLKHKQAPVDIPPATPTPPLVQESYGELPFPGGIQEDDTSVAPKADTVASLPFDGLK